MVLHGRCHYWICVDSVVVTIVGRVHNRIFLDWFRNGKMPVVCSWICLNNLRVWNLSHDIIMIWLAVRQFLVGTSLRGRRRSSHGASRLAILTVTTSSFSFSLIMLLVIELFDVTLGFSSR